MRRLTLKKDTLAALTSEELGGLVGASYKTKYDCTESYQFCFTNGISGCVLSDVVSCTWS